MERKPRVYILGATGYLGSFTTQYLREKGYEVFDERVDVADLASLKDVFSRVKPDVVMNLSGPPAQPNVDWCEDHKAETVAMLVAAPINFTLAAIENNAYPIQVTSGCIYSGGVDHAYTEEEPANFFGSFYSRMRVVGQQALGELPVLQVRIRMPISSVPHPRNFINKIVSYKKVISVPNSVTLLEDMVVSLEKIIRTRPLGVLNLTNSGYIEHSQVLKKYKEIVDPTHTYELITLDELHGFTKAERSNCILSTEKAKELGIDMPEINEERLVEIMKKYKSLL